METAKTYNRTFRIMHWAIALCILFMLFTIGLRLGWMNKNNMAEILLSKSGELGVKMDEESAVKLAKQIRKPMWEWHILIGYVLIGLYVIRMLLAVFKKMIFMNPFTKGITGKQKFQAYLYLSFYLFIGITLATGFLIVNGPDSIHETMEEIHELALYYILFFIFFHIGGVFASEFSSGKGIISRVISGER